MPRCRPALIAAEWRQPSRDVGERLLAEHPCHILFGDRSVIGGPGHEGDDHPCNAIAWRDQKDRGVSRKP